MRYTRLWLWLVLVLTTDAFARTTADSTAGLFQKLSGQLGLKEPRLNANEYEVRIWNRVALRYGDAQMVYVLRKTSKQLSIVKYIIESNRQGFQRATKLKPTVSVTRALWKRLLAKNLLTMPDQSAVLEQLYKQPEPPKDTIQGGLQADGSFTVKGRKSRLRRVIVGDGEGYEFEVFTANGYRQYTYGNPDIYARAYPENEDLRNVLSILNDISLVFRSDKTGRGQARAINKDQHE
jgi:hypothetical protein